MPMFERGIAMPQPRSCLSCEKGGLHRVLSLGALPVADVLLDDVDSAKPEPVFPLELFFCDACSLVQIGDVVPPELLYGGSYPYYSSLVPGLIRQYEAFIANLIKERSLNLASRVLEVGSNDGYLLGLLKK